MLVIFEKGNFVRGDKPRTTAAIINWAAEILKQ